MRKTFNFFLYSGAEIFPTSSCVIPETFCARSCLFNLLRDQGNHFSKGRLLFSARVKQASSWRKLIRLIHHVSVHTYVQLKRLSYRSETADFHSITRYMYVQVHVHHKCRRDQNNREFFAIASAWIVVIHM